MADYLVPQRRPPSERQAAFANGLATRIENLQAEVDLDLTASKWLLKKKIAGSKVAKLLPCSS
jgi:hypothetical protein